MQMSVSKMEIDPGKTMEVELKSLLPLPKNVILLDDTVDNRIALLAELEKISYLPDEEIDGEIEEAIDLLVQ